MHKIYQIIASLSLDFYVENLLNRKSVENVLDEDAYEVINEIALSIQRKLRANEDLTRKLEDFYDREISKSMSENLFMDIDIHEKNINGIEFFIAFCNYVAQEETRLIVNEFLYKRGCSN